MRSYRSGVFIVYFFLLLLSGFRSLGQWQLAGGAEGPIHTADTHIATDDSGNVYVAGSFTGRNMSFFLKTLYNDSAGGEDIFLARYNAAGHQLWEKRIGGRGSDRIRGLAVDGQGNITISGDFTGNTCSFDSVTVSGSGCPKFFLAHFNPNGNLRWVRTCGYADNWPGCPENYGSDIATAGGYIFASMYFVGTMVLGADTFRTSLYDRYESLVLKYDTTGQLLWSRQIHSEPYTFVVVTSLAVDSSQNVYGAGLSDGNTQVAAPVSAAGGGYRWKHFLFKLDSSGAGRHISKLFSNSCCDKTLFRVATGGYNTVYVAGYFGNANTDSLKLGSSALITTAPGTSDLFLARYDTTCNLLWARNAAGTGNDYLYGLAADSRGRAYIAGSFYSTTIAFGTHLLYRKDTFSACFAACDSNGVFVYARGADGGGNNSVAGITCRNTGEVYVAGNFNDSIRLGIWGHHLPTGGENAFFWAQYHETGLDGVTRVGSSTISLWPNPCNTQGILHLSAQVQQAVLTDVAGKVVANWRQTALLQLPALLPGVYLLKATVDNITWNSVLVHVE